MKCMWRRRSSVIAAGAIEVRTRPPAAEGKKQKRIIYAGRLRLRLVPDRRGKELTSRSQHLFAWQPGARPCRTRPSDHIRCDHSSC
jgi:hypothetical protein